MTLHGVLSKQKKQDPVLPPFDCEFVRSFLILTRNNGSELKAVRWAGRGGGVISEIRAGHQYDGTLDDRLPALPLRLRGDCIAVVQGQ
jgi:hypothetical protein